METLKKLFKNKILLTVFLFVFIFVCGKINVNAEPVNVTTSSSIQIENQVLNPQTVWKKFDDTDSNISYSSIQVGNQVLNPETGWKRFDDTDPNISYDEYWSIGGELGYYLNDKYHVTAKIDSSAKFNFTGDKIRLYYTPYVKNRSQNIQVIIDNKIIENFAQPCGEACKLIIFYEKTGLQSKEHSIEFINKQNTAFMIDAIDIDENGELKPYNPNVFSSISLNKTSTNLIVGQTETLIATVLPKNSNKNIIWSSSKENIVTVDQNGIITAISEGTAIITATTGDGSLTASCNVSVEPPIITRAILNITLTNGTIKEYDLSMNEISKFISWYDNKSNGNGQSFFSIKKNSNITPFLNRKDYVILNNIYMFEVNEYVTN